MPALPSHCSTSPASSLIAIRFVVGRIGIANTALAGASVIFVDRSGKATSSTRDRETRLYSNVMVGNKSRTFLEETRGPVPSVRGAFPQLLLSIPEMKNIKKDTSPGQQEDFFPQLFSIKDAELANFAKNATWIRRMIHALVNTGLRCFKRGRKPAARGCAPASTESCHSTLVLHPSRWKATYSTGGTPSKKFFQFERSARRFAAQQQSRGSARINP